MRKNTKNRWLAGVMAAVLAASLLGGCGGGSTDSSTAAETTTAAAETTQAAETAAPETEGTTAAAEESQAAEAQAAESDLAAQVRGNTDPSPELIEQVNSTFDDSYLGDFYGLGSDYSAFEGGRFDGVTLDIWMPSLYGTADIYSDLSQHPVFQQISKLTGIQFNFITPTVGEEKTEFNLMVSGGDLPDIIINGVGNYPGGVVAAAEDGLILDLTPYEDKLPNFMTYANSRDSIIKDLLTDDGRLLTVTELYTVLSGVPYGPNIKKKAMEDAGWTDPPETVDEWHSFLLDCKNAGYDIPLVANMGKGFLGGYGFICSAYGVYDGLFVNDEGKVAYGPVQDGLEDYLTEMNQWYTEGLFDPDFLTADGARRTSLISSEETAVLVNSSIAIKDQLQCDYSDIISVPIPALNKGDQPTMLHYSSYVASGSAIAITTQCDNIDAALAFADFGFSKKGWELYGLGSYGDAHLVDEEGRPYYHEDSLLFTDEDCVQKAGNWRASKFRLHHFPGAFSDEDSNPEGNEEAFEMQRERTDPCRKVGLPPVSLTAEESSSIADIRTNIETLRDEYVVKIFTGQLPVSAAQEFRDQAAQMGLDTYVSVYQDAYDRYQAR